MVYTRDDMVMALQVLDYQLSITWWISKIVIQHSNPLLVKPSGRDEKQVRELRNVVGNVVEREKDKEAGVMVDARSMGQDQEPSLRAVAAEIIRQVGYTGM